MGVGQSFFSLFSRRPSPPCWCAFSEASFFSACLLPFAAEGEMAMLAAGQMMASGLLGPLCERVTSAALEKFKLVSGVEEEVKKLGFTVSLMKGVFQDAEEKQVREEAVRTWLRQLKQVLYDAEDVLDEAAACVALQAGQFADARSGDHRKAKVRNILNRNNIAQQIKAIREELDHLSKERHALGLRVLDGNSWPVDGRPRRRPDTDSLLADKSYVIGRDDEKEKIVQLLLASGGEVGKTSGTSRARVLTITGMGGVGKTTLAKLVFNDPTVKQYFTLLIWVCVSEDFNLKRITEEIMDAAVASSGRGGTFENKNWDLTRRSLRDAVEDQRYLLVLDDVWEEDPSKWEDLLEPLRCGGKGSQILVTTRSQKASKITKGIPFELKSLSSESLWPIFERYAFDGHDSNRHTHLETLARQIVQRLKGSPLAAKTIGCLLNSNLDVKYWKNIMKSDIWTLQQHAGDILPILKLSYDHLPGNLKQCFAYCSLFPKDHKFNRGELVQLWMSQHFIPLPRSLLEESIKIEHFNDLWYRSFFEQGSKSEEFVMHDLIHDLAESISEDDCFRMEDVARKEISETVRHVSVTTENCDMTKLEELINHGNLRTLIFLFNGSCRLSSKLDVLLPKLKRLRVLRLRGCNISHLPTSIGCLKQLRFLDISKTHISELPEAICDLQNLQVLKLSHCGMLGALPSTMSALTNLRHLDADKELVSNIRGLGKLTALQELHINGRKVRELEELCMLEALRTWNLGEVESKEEAVQARLDLKENLDSLELVWEDERDDHPVNPRLEEGVLESLQPVDSIKRLTIKGYGGVESPRWMEHDSWVSSSFLERVELENCRNWEVLPPLGRLPCLRFLGIGGMKRAGQMGLGLLSCCVGGVQAFPVLEELSLRDLTEWEAWEYPHPHQQPPSFLPRLRRLSIYRCPKLRKLPPLPLALAELHIVCGGLTHLPGWSPSPSSSSSSPALSSLFIFDCPNLTSLGDGLLQEPLPNLQSVEISYCRDLVSLPERGFAHHASLKSLEIHGCRKLSWKASARGEDPLPCSLTKLRVDGYGGMREDVLLGSLQKLTSLTSLEIGDYSMRHFDLPWSLEHLSIASDRRLDDESLSVCLRGLASLRSLSISSCPSITSLPRAEALSQLTAFQRLTIKCMQELTTVGGFPTVATLEDLEIWGCPKLLHLVKAATSPSPPPTVRVMSLKYLRIHHSSPEQIKVWLLHCPSLRLLHVSSCPLLECFDDASGDDVGRDLEAALLNLASSLRYLRFRSCENLCSLPSELRGLSSLESLRIWNCPRIRCLPVAGLPQSLKELTIDNCAALKERCTKVIGPDWPLISLIPHLDVS